MGKLRVHNIEAQTGTNVDLGAAGDVVTLASDSIQTNLYKDSGGNTLFQSDGAGTLSNVNSGLKGAGPVLILSQTASGSAAVAFTSGIDNTYDKYMFVFIDLNPSDEIQFSFNASINSGSTYAVTKTTTAYYARHSESGSPYSGELTYASSDDIAQGTGYQKISIKAIGNDADETLSGILYLFAPGSITYVKHFYARTMHVGDSPEAMDAYVAGYFNTTAALNAIDFKMETGNFDGTIKMYGCR